MQKKKKGNYFFVSRKNEILFFLDTWLCFCCYVTTKIYHHDIIFKTMSETKVWSCTKNNFVSKQKIWCCTKSNMVSTRTSWCLSKKLFYVKQKKVDVAQKGVSCRQKQDDAAQKNYFVLKKVIIFFRNGAPSIKPFLVWNIYLMKCYCVLLFSYHVRVSEWIYTL